MTVLDLRPPTRRPAPGPRWQWRVFEADGWAHLYRVAELHDPRRELLSPWCLRRAPFPLEHDRPSIRPRPVLPRRGRTCQACAAHVWAVILHPHDGTPVAGEFTGELFEVVTRDVR